MALGAGLVGFGLWDSTQSATAVCGDFCASVPPAVGLYVLAIPGAFVIAFGIAFLLPSRSTTGLGLMLVGTVLGLYTLMTFLVHWGGVGGGVVDFLIVVVPAVVAFVSGFLLWEPRPSRSLAR